MPRVRMPAARLAVALLVVLCCGVAVGGRSTTVDCLPDRVAAWAPVADNPGQLFGAAFMPGVVLGPPGDSEAWEGALTVATLGFGGSVTLAFDDVVVEDGPGPDFIVFENAFFKLPLPLEGGDPLRIFAEPAFVEVSVDGVTWAAFPYDSRALAGASGVADIDGTQFAALGGLAGVTPTFTGNWTRPDERTSFDADGVGGVTGAGGDAFDLADVGLTAIRYVRITDADSRNGFAGGGAGFDLDAVVALHARPAHAPQDDRDGDGLGDLAEERLYGSDPDDDDSDGDGVDDGREVAGCRDPAVIDDAPSLVGETRLWLLGGGCTEARWSFAGSGRAYDLLRGVLGAWAEDAAKVDLDATTCLATEHTQLRWACDATIPAPGEGHFYLVRVAGDEDYGRSSRLNPREAFDGCP